MTQKTALAMHHLRGKWALKYRTDADMGSRKHRYHPGQARGSRAARTWMSQVRLESPRRPARQRGSGRADEATCGREGADSKSEKVHHLVRKAIFSVHFGWHADQPIATVYTRQIFDRRPSSGAPKSNTTLISDVHSLIVAPMAAPIWANFGPATRCSL